MRMHKDSAKTVAQQAPPTNTSAHRRLKTFKAVQFVKKAAATVAGGLAIGTATLNSAAPADGAFDATAHHDRWPIKTSVETNGALATPKFVDVKTLENLTDIDEKNRSAFDGARIPETVSGLQEGQIVQTEGYIHLAVTETDSDYHIQINEKPTDDSSDLNPCLIVEVPHPNATADPTLSDEFARVRKFVRDNCFGGNAPTGTVNPPVRVRITGQLFYDLFHAQGRKDPGGGRGKTVGGQPMHATTIWEIHPITDMTLSPASP